MSQTNAQSKVFIIPPIYRRLVHQLRDMGFRIGTMPVNDGTVNTIEGTKARVKTALKRLGNYGIVGFARVGDDTYKFVGKQFKKKRKDCKLGPRICRDCKRVCSFDKQIKRKSRCCGSKIVKMRHAAYKDHHCQEKEQRRCLKSIYGKRVRPWRRGTRKWAKREIRRQPRRPIRGNGRLRRQIRRTAQGRITRNHPYWGTRQE